MEGSRSEGGGHEGPRWVPAVATPDSREETIRNGFQGPFGSGLQDPPPGHCFGTACARQSAVQHAGLALQAEPGLCRWLPAPCWSAAGRGPGSWLGERGSAQPLRANFLPKQRRNYPLGRRGAGPLLTHIHALDTTSRSSLTFIPLKAEFLSGAGGTESVLPSGEQGTLVASFVGGVAVEVVLRRGGTGAAGEGPAEGNRWGGRGHRNVARVTAAPPGLA